MSDLKEKLEQLEDKLDSVSKQLDNILFDFRKLESFSKENDWNLFKIALVFSTVFGIWTGLLVSYMMKVYEEAAIPTWVWGVSTIGLWVSLFIALIAMWKAKRPPNI
jgi:hypothetical protein